jgi:hypothetical protein
MTRQVTVRECLWERFCGVLYVIATVLFIWIVYQLHQMNKRHNELVQWLATEMTTASQEMEVAHERQPANVCVPLLPVQLWNRSPEDVPIPPHWHRRMV